MCILSQYFKKNLRLSKKDVITFGQRPSINISNGKREKGGMSKGTMKNKKLPKEFNHADSER